MKIFITKVLLVLLLCPVLIEYSSAQYNTPYKKQIKYLLDDAIGNKCGFKFQYTDNKIIYDVNFSSNDSLNWDINIKKDTNIIRNYFHPFDIVHQIGIVQPGKSKETCILVVSATGGNGIITNEFTLINPEFKELMSVQINYILKHKNITFDYNKATLDEHRTDEIKFIIGLVGEYDMIWYERYQEKK